MTNYLIMAECGTGHQHLLVFFQHLSYNLHYTHPGQKYNQHFGDICRKNKRGDYHVKTIANSQRHKRSLY